MQLIWCPGSFNKSFGVTKNSQKIIIDFFKWVRLDIGIDNFMMIGKNWPKLKKTKKNQ